MSASTHDRDQGHPAAETETRARGPVPQWLRRGLVLLLHTAIFAAAYTFAVLLRNDLTFGRSPAESFQFLPLAVAIQTVVFALHGTHRGWMRYAGLEDLFTITKASLLSLALVVLVLAVGWRLEGASRSILLMHCAFTILGIGGARFGARLVREVIRPQWLGGELGPRLLIVGAGDTGAGLIREIRRNAVINYQIVGLLDDDPKKLGTVIHSASVLGTCDRLPELVKQLRVDEVIIAAPTATGKEMRRLVALCRDTGVRFRRLPALEDLVHGSIDLAQIRDVDIVDLLRREPAELDHTAISAYVAGRVVLVTGAAGSIGSELCRQVAQFSPRELVLVERFENALFLLQRELRAQFPALPLRAAIGDVTDRERMQELFERFSPEAVFHAAAHKHVPMMEQDPGEAVKNNVFGTRVVADLADQYGVHTFVLISTDKAVNPSSVMGATKRAAEIYVQAVAARSRTRFVAVRFGNVLGSSGSVVPLFQEQIRKGGPVEITHPDMQRYFMTIPEAAQLVLQAAAMGQGGEVFVLDMGAPVRILDLARDLIRLNGFTDGEIEIRYSGIRPGEKLFEELSLSGESASKTRHPKIWIGHVEAVPAASVEAALVALARAVRRGTSSEIRLELSKMVPQYARVGTQPRSHVEEPSIGQPSAATAMN